MISENNLTNETDKFPPQKENFKDASTDRGIYFEVEKYYYIISASNDPKQTVQTVRVVGETNGQIITAYLYFSDKMAANRNPVYDEPNRSVHIFYPDSYLPVVEKMLESETILHCIFYEYQGGKTWASIESDSIER